MTRKNMCNVGNKKTIEELNEKVKNQYILIGEQKKKIDELNEEIKSKRSFIEHLIKDNSRVQGLFEKAKNIVINNSTVNIGSD